MAKLIKPKEFTKGNISGYVAGYNSAESGREVIIISKDKTTLAAAFKRLSGQTLDMEGVFVGAVYSVADLKPGHEIVIKPKL